MAYIPAVGEVLRASIVSSLENQIALNNIHYQVFSVVGGGVDLTALASAIDAITSANLPALLTNDADYRGVILHAFQAVPQPAAGIRQNVNPGTAGTAELPKQDAGLLSFRTEFAGPGGRGRWFVPFPDEADSNAGAPSGGYLTRLTNLGTALLPQVVATAGGATTTLTPGLWHIPQAPGVPSFRPYESFIARPYWATQKRRGDFGRPNSIPV